MDAAELKSILGGVASNHGFVAAHGGWYRNTRSATMVLSLQRSNFGSYFDLNIKLFIEVWTDKSLSTIRDKIKKGSGDVFIRQPKYCSSAFDLESSLDANKRIELLNKMFEDTIERIAIASEIPDEMFKLRDEGVIHLLPMTEALLKANSRRPPSGSA
jgi:hypothetical protein